MTLTGARMYLLAVIEHATRRVRILGATAPGRHRAPDHRLAHPGGGRVRNLAMDLQDTRGRARFLIRDRDGKYPALFDAILADTGITTVLSGVQIPRTNAIMERWIQSRRHELLDRMPLWNQAHLPHALHQYQRHYNAHRPHRGIANARPLHPLPEPTTNPDTIMHLTVRRHDQLGGIIHEYEHAA